MRLLLITLTFLLAAISSHEGRAQTPATNDDPKIAAARSVFEQYVSLSDSFDASVAELYSDNALIQNTRTYPDGRQRTMTLPAQQYKEMIRNAMPLAKLRGDTDNYRDVNYTIENGKVRIKATRHNNMKDYDSPISILMAESQPGKWLIIEEITESKP